MKVQPLARQSSLIVKEVDDETLVYDLETDQAHCLNSTAARVWKSCDGRTSVEEIAHRLSVRSNTQVPADAVSFAIEQLEKFNLLDHPAGLAVTSRRTLIRTLALSTAFAIPLVTSIVVPTAAQAQSFGPCCTKNSDCDAYPGTSCNSSEHAPCGKTCN